MEIIEHHDQRSATRQPLEQLSDGGVDAEPFHGGHRMIRCTAERTESREDGSKRTEAIGCQALHDLRVERRQECIERIDDQSEGHVTLELGRPAFERQAAASGGEVSQMSKEARLPDPGFTVESDERWRTTEGSVQRGGQNRDFGTPSDQHRLGWARVISLVRVGA
jgi:hypothetical protein